jgi:ferredoxin
MKIQVDTKRCQGTAMCLAVAPELFDILPNGIAEVLVDDIGPDLAATAEDAALACPAAAITVIGDQG